MEIALVATGSKNELMAEFCIAYCGILSKHHLFATQPTAKLLAEATGLNIEPLLSVNDGGIAQLASRVSYNEIDAVFYFKDYSAWNDFCTDDETALMKNCDGNNIPVATNLAAAEILLMSVDAGNLDWREIYNPLSNYNRNKKK